MYDVAECPGDLVEKVLNDRPSFHFALEFVCGHMASLRRRKDAICNPAEAAHSSVLGRIGWDCLVRCVSPETEYVLVEIDADESTSQRRVGWDEG